MNEIDLVVQRRQKPNSSEIETNLMQPNDAFWRFISEVQPTDLRSCCFSEELDIMKDEEIVGNLSINITKGEKVELDGKEIGTLLVEAKTVGGQGESAVSQTIKSKITDDLQLVNETKTEDTYLSAKKIETQYIPNYGYRMTRTIEHKQTEDEASFQTHFGDGGDAEMAFLTNEAKVILCDGPTLLLQRLLPKIGVYQIDLPYLDIDAKHVSLSSISSLGFRTETIDGTEVDLVGIQRCHNLKYGPHVYNMWLFEDGHIASRESVSGTVQLQVNQMPELIKDEEDLEPVIVLQKLDWHQDMQLKSIYRQRAKELSTSHRTYIQENGDMMKLLRDFYTSVLSQKPDDVYKYASKYFDSYAP